MPIMKSGLGSNDSESLSGIETEQEVIELLDSVNGWGSNDSESLSGIETKRFSC